MRTEPELKSESVEPVETPEGPSKQEILDQCKNIAASEEFRNALSQQRLLQYLVLETIEGRGGALKEYSVGLQVFQRTQDFDPRTDAIVRVTVGQLRRRLTAYYNSAGSQDRVLIRIPKGHYAAEFTYAEPTALPDNRTAAAWLSEQERLASLSASGHWATGQRSLLVLAVALLLVIASLSFWVYRLRSEDAVHLNGSHNVDLRQSLLWSTFLHGETHSIAVVGIASSVSIGPVIVRVPDANDDQSMQSDPTIQKLSGLFDKPVSPYNIYTGIGEALAAGKLERAFTDSSLDLSLLASREVRWQDLHADNVIFISSLRFRDLRNALGRTSDFDAAEFSNGQLQIINHAPRPGEQSSYAPSGNSTQPTVDYALVSIVPGTASNRSILSVGGMSTLGTLGAMQYITEKQSLTDLDTKLRHDSTPKTHSSVQILLRVDIIDYQVVSVHYVTHHWIS